MLLILPSDLADIQSRAACYMKYTISLLAVESLLGSSSSASQNAIDSAGTSDSTVPANIGREVPSSKECL